MDAWHTGHHARSSADGQQGAQFQQRLAGYEGAAGGAEAVDEPQPAVWVRDPRQGDAAYEGPAVD